MSNTQAIDLYDKINANPFESIRSAGEMLAKSGMFGCDKVEQGMVLAWACFAEKKSPFEIKRTYHLMQGELSMRADAMLAQFRVRGGKHKVLSRTAEKAAIELTLDGQTNLFSFSWEEASKEPFVTDKNGKLKKNYATPRARMQMLWARVISDAVHAMAPEIVSGTYTPEEIEDTDQPSRDINLTKAAGAGSQSAGVSAAETKSTVTVEKPAPSPAKPTQPVVEVEAVITSTPEKESKPPAPTEAPAAKVTAAVDPATGRLTTETQQAVIAAIGEENLGNAQTWLVDRNKLKKDQTIGFLTVKIAQNIIDQPDVFRTAIKPQGK